MVPFIVLLTVPIIITPFLKNVKISKTSFYNFSLFLFFVILTILVMFRHKYIGNDTGNYMAYFVKYSYYGWGQFGKAGIEPGFFIYNKIIALFTRDPHVFIAVSGIVVSALIYPTYRRLCEDPVLTIVLFCTMSTFSMMFSGIRQMLAVGIGLIAYEFVRRRKLIFFIIVVVIAVTIHTSAFMLAFMYPLFYAKTQDLPPLYEETSGFYIYKNEVMTKFCRRIGDKPFIVEVSEIESIDIDEPEDFMIADAIYNHLYKDKD